MRVQQAVPFRERVVDYPNRLLQPQVLLPSQQKQTGDVPERRLLVAMLADAINCLQRHGMAPGRGSRRAARESEAWIMSRDRDWPFSFENVCEFLEIDASYVRASLLRWRARPGILGPASGRVQRIATVHRVQRIATVHRRRSQCGSANVGEGA